MINLEFADDGDDDGADVFARLLLAEVQHDGDAIDGLLESQGRNRTCNSNNHIHNGATFRRIF